MAAILDQAWLQGKFEKVSPKYYSACEQALKLNSAFESLFAGYAPAVVVVHYPYCTWGVVNTSFWNKNNSQIDEKAFKFLQIFRLFFAEIL